LDEARDLCDRARRRQLRQLGLGALYERLQLDRRLSSGQGVKFGLGRIVGGLRLARASVVAVSIAAAFTRPPDALPSAAVTLYAPDRASARSEISAADHRRASTLRMSAGHDRANTMATAPATAAHTTDVASVSPFCHP
jgi:hypothetical protein